MRNEKITYKIREHSMQKVPYILVVGDKEKANGAVAVRARGNQDLGVMPLADFLEKIADLVREKRIEGISDLRNESSREGMRIVVELKRDAVAQVVLNRVRHPAFPKSVCGVVYQGAERRTGCQFSFTCDSSLAQGPVDWAWRRAAIVSPDAMAFA